MHNSFVLLNSDTAILTINVSLFPSSTMRCFKWRAKRCSGLNGPQELCNLQNRQTEEIELINNDEEAHLYSPAFNSAILDPNHAWGKKYFCIYNVSLSCPGNAKIERINHLTTWPHKTEGCHNYVAFYNDRSSSSYEHQHCGTAPAFGGEMQGSSFMAIMWNSGDSKNKGTFEFRASCADPRPTQETVATAETVDSRTDDTGSSTTQQPIIAIGSGDADLDSTNA